MGRGLAALGLRWSPIARIVWDMFFPPFFSKKTEGVYQYPQTEDGAPVSMTSRFPVTGGSTCVNTGLQNNISFILSKLKYGRLDHGYRRTWKKAMCCFRFLPMLTMWPLLPWFVIAPAVLPPLLCILLVMKLSHDQISTHVVNHKCAFLDYLVQLERRKRLSELMDRQASRQRARLQRRRKAHAQRRRNQSKRTGTKKSILRVYDAVSIANLTDAWATALWDKTPRTIVILLTCVLVSFTLPLLVAVAVVRLGLRTGYTHRHLTRWYLLMWYVYGAMQGSSVSLGAALLIISKMHCSSPQRCRFASCAITLSAGIERQHEHYIHLVALVAFLPIFGSARKRKATAESAQAKTRVTIGTDLMQEEEVGDDRSAPLQNGGNSCYMNATLQALWSCRSARQASLEHYSRMDLDNKRRLLQLAVETQNRRKQLHVNFDYTTLMADAYRIAYAASAPRSEPAKLQLLLNQYHYPKAGVNLRQQDAHEFLGHMLHSLEKPDLSQGVLSENHETTLSSLLQGEMQPTYICSQGHVTRTLLEDSRVAGKEFFQVLPIGIISREGHPLCTLQEAWELHMEEEETDRFFKFACSECGCVRRPKKKWEVISMPKILCLQLKRFTFDEVAGGAQVLEHTIEYNTVETFTNTKYNLRGVVFHSGVSVDSGHYWAVTQHTVNKNTGWWLYNDDQRRSATIAETMQSHAHSEPDDEPGKSYLLFFEMEEDPIISVAADVSQHNRNRPMEVSKDVFSEIAVNDSNDANMIEQRGIFSESSCQDVGTPRSLSAAIDAESASDLTVSQVIAAATLEIVAGSVGNSRMWREYISRCGYPKMSISDIVQMSVTFAHEACGNSVTERPTTELPCPRGCPVTFEPGAEPKHAYTETREDRRRESKRNEQNPSEQMPEEAIPMIREAEGTEAHLANELDGKYEEMMCDVVDVETNGRQPSQNDVHSIALHNRKTDVSTQPPERSQKKLGAMHGFDEPSIIADVDWRMYVSSLESRLASMRLRFVLAPLMTCADDKRQECRKNLEHYAQALACETQGSEIEIASVVSAQLDVRRCINTWLAKCTPEAPTFVTKPPSSSRPDSNTEEQNKITTQGTKSITSQTQSDEMMQPGVARKMLKTGDTHAHHCSSSHGQSRRRERQQTRFAPGGCGPACAQTMTSVPAEAEANEATPHNMLDGSSCQAVLALPTGSKPKTTRSAPGCYDPACAPGTEEMPGEVEITTVTTEQPKDMPHITEKHSSCDVDRNATNTETSAISDAVSALATAPDFATYHVAHMPASVSRHPRAALEQAIFEIVEHIREKPTIPADPENAQEPWRLALRSDIALQLPSKHCAFKGCVWTGEDDRHLYKHTREKHGLILEKAAQLLSIAFPEEHRMEAVYNEAIAEKCRTGAPTSAHSIDRRCLQKYVKAASGHNVQEPICFMCACSYPYLEHRSASGKYTHIEWVQPFSADDNDGTKVGTCFGMNPGETATTLGLMTYLDDYGKDTASKVNMRKRMHEFKDWTLDVPFQSETVSLLCCPEDRQCENKTCTTSACVCPKCRVPVCHECLKYLHKDVMHADNKVPPQALANDMMVFYAPRVLYERGMTVIEMMCASVCITSMICFAMEVKHGHMMNSQMHMQRHRVGARGNVTSFPMPWHDLLAALQQAKTDESESRPPSLPHDPMDLAAVVQVLLKSNEESDFTQMKKFIHQATVRRDVVIEAILEAKYNGHRAYIHLDEQEVRRRAAKFLPTEGIPEAFIRLLPHDGDIDKIQIQKAATPIEGRVGTVAELLDPFKTQRPNAVIAERSCYDIVDTNATHSTATLLLGRQLESETSKQDTPEKIPVSKRPRTVASHEMQTFWSKVFTTWLAPYVHNWVDRKSRNAMASTCKTMNLRTSDTSTMKAALTAFAKLPVECRKAYVLSTGSTMIDQFEPWYFGIAFAFCFKYCTGMPDMPAFAKRPRHRRKPDAPRIELALWVRIMARRVESQLRRDWLLQFSTGNLLFRTAINLTNTIYSYESAARSDGSKGFTAAELEEGAINICKALQSTYTDPCGRTQAVKGDFTKVHRVAWLTEAAQCMLKNVKALTRKISGTDETRILMRYDTNACRVHRGAAPLFVTISPDEKHNMLMLRLSRTRRNDPVCSIDANAKSFGGLFKPEMGVDFVQTGVSIDMLRDQLPSYDERRAILARDSLASVDGSRLLMSLLLEYIFGVRFCDACPDCSHSKCFHPCMDLFGSNATPEGGVFGRVDGVYISIEAQKSSGSLHFHAQVFVQCLHQHCSLEEIYKQMCSNPMFDVSEYLRYAEHVTRQVYADPDGFTTRRNEIEETWPEYKTSLELVTTPSYLSRQKPAMHEGAQTNTTESLEQEGGDWLHEHLNKHVQMVQEKKQHHVHPRTGKNGERQLLQHCRRTDEPSKCKGDFPRDEWLLPEPCVLCPGILADRNMPASGRRNKLGCLQARGNHGCLNASHPALMTAEGSFNTDVQIPWRLPITQATHNTRLCEHPCLETNTASAMVVAAGKCQAAQAGYACDYCNKRLARGFQEVKEHIKGHHHMARTLAAGKNQSAAYIGKRHTGRILSDAYGKDVVRSQQERTNLNANTIELDVTAAETIRTSQREPFPGNELLSYIENRNTDNKRDKYVRGEVDHRDPRCKQWLTRDSARFYARRPMDTDVAYLSPYEFWMYWEIVPALYAATTDMMVQEHEDPGLFHCTLTTSGITKVLARSDAATSDENEERLHAGHDYVVKENNDDPWWIAFPDTDDTRSFRHNWVLQRRLRPRDPTFHGCALPYQGDKDPNRTAKILMTYFRPWSAWDDAADDQVVNVAAMRADSWEWSVELDTWLQGGVLTLQVERCIRNFLTVVQARPEGSGPGDAAHDDDVYEDAEITVEHDALNSLLMTTKRKDVEPEENVAQNDPSYAIQAQAMDIGRAVWNEYHNGIILGKLNNNNNKSTEEVDMLIKTAQNIERQKDQGDDKADSERHESCTKREVPTAQQMRQWMQRKKDEKRSESTVPEYTAKQLEFMEKIVKRACEERGDDQRTTDPLIWCMHGGPGVGKSHTLKLMREFFEFIGYRSNVEYVMTALQAVMAEQLQGDTLHHALGITPAQFKSNSGSETFGATKRQTEVARFMEQCRWLVIDEVSMISAQLLADIDKKLRRVMRDIEATKKNANCLERPFGGVNVIFSGDFWQLDPPSGTAIATIPTELVQKARQYEAAPDVKHGHSLFWGKALNAGECVQGITELTECMRCDDDWLLTVQEEMRMGNMSADTHAFLHGKPTRVPGAYIKNTPCWDARCQGQCKQLYEAACMMSSKEAETHIHTNECQTCKEERKSRQLVATDADDMRFVEPAFRAAPCIFPNNSVKYDVNKVRAQQYAVSSGQGIAWAQACDKPSQRVLQGRTHLVRDKKRWLTWHDKDCGDLYGMLPLIQGMPVMLQDHVSRNTEYQLLRGKLGHIHSWVEHEHEHGTEKNGVKILTHVPKVVFVKYENEEWKLPGMQEPGLYPIRPWTRTWYIDKNRKKPILSVARWQLPLAPAFAMTAHASQGQTLDAAIVDLQQGVGVSTIASYVAITRVKRRQALIIYRPFDRALFCKGPLQGPTLLLKVLRGETVDWNALEQEMIPGKRCLGCGMKREKNHYSPADWRDVARVWCKTCHAEKAEAGTPLLCSRCHKWKTENDYNKHSLKFGRRRHCKSCAGAEVRPCHTCARELIEANFGSTWNQEDSSRVCQDCDEQHQTRDCSECKTKRPVHAFSAWQLKNGRRVCEACLCKAHHCDICQQTRANITVSGETTSDGRVLACTSCGKCRCANDVCGHVLTAREKEKCGRTIHKRETMKLIRV